MNSKLLSASVLALATLASANSFAESGDYTPPTPYGQTTSSLSRAEVRADLMAAKRAGYDANFVNDSSGPVAINVPQAQGKTRDEVKAEMMASRPLSSGTSDDHDYPVVQ
jgi:Domain of unknown function (DUF4148)